MKDGPSGRQCLTRGQRLRQSGDFARIRASGQRIALGCLIANWAASMPGRGSRLGVITGRKVGNAVIRNRARRLLREAYRRHQGELCAATDLVLVARPSIANQTFVNVEADFLHVMRKARLITAVKS